MERKKGEKEGKEVEVNKGKAIKECAEVRKRE